MVGHICTERKAPVKKIWVPKVMKIPAPIVEEKVVTPEVDQPTVSSTQEWHIAKRTFKNYVARKVIMSEQKSGFALLVEEEAVGVNYEIGEPSHANEVEHGPGSIT